MTKKLLAAVFSLAATLATAQNPYLPCGNIFPMVNLACLRTPTIPAGYVPISLVRTT